MSFDVVIYADASPRAIEAFASLGGLEGRRYRFPPKTPGIATPPMGLLAACDDHRACLDPEDLGAPEPPHELELEGPPHEGLPEGSWGTFTASGREWPHRLYPAPSLRALGALRRLAHRTRARVWVICEHERGDDLYDQWAWLFAPARSGEPAYELALGLGGDAGQVLWQRDLIGPEPWRIFDDRPSRTPAVRLVEHLGLRGRGFVSCYEAPGRHLEHAF